MRAETQKKIAIAIVCAVVLAGFGLKWAHRPRDYRNALQTAVIRGDLAEVERLLNKGADPNSSPVPGSEPPLQKALIFNMNNRLEMVALLLKHGADPNATLADGTPVMKQAVQFQKLTPDIVRLFAEAGAELNKKDKDGDTILAFCVSPPWTAPADTIEALLASGADPNVLRKDGSTALHGAVERHFGDELSVIRLLLTHGADPNVKDSKGLTPLGRCWFSKEDAVLALVEAGTDLSVPNAQGELPLATALQRNKPRAALLMLEKGAEPNIEDRWGKTPLFRVAADGNLALAKALVAKGANVNHASKSGATPLHAAAARSQKEMVDYLIAQGAKVDAKDKKGLTPIEYAEGRNAPADAQKRKSSMIDSLSKAKDKQ